MRQIIMCEESFEKIYDECMGYLLECDNADERIAYWEELRDCRGEYGTLRGDRNWAKLTTTGIFHDAIGELDRVIGNSLFVEIEY